MKILLICMQYDYGEESRGYSYEYYNFYKSLLDMGHDVSLFDFMTEVKSFGKLEMNRKLISLVQETQPNLALFSLFTDQFEPDTISQIREFTTTLCFFHDDTWRVEYSQFWARHFDYFTTSDVYGEQKYKALGMENAIHFPFGCNEKLFQDMHLPKQSDVAFIGSWHPYREWLVKRLRKAGFSVVTAGYGWPLGILEHEEMVRIFNSSKINLNMSNSASWDARYLSSSFRGLINRIRSPKNKEQIKARHFEINGCGAFQLSYYVEGLETYYKIGQEIAIYVDPDDLIDKVRIYIENEKLRKSIARDGYLRTISSHTFAIRFGAVFERMGLNDA